MLKNQLLSNLSMNLNRMDKLQNQMASGRKYGHISDDPSALIYGQAARNKLAKISHYQNTVNTAQSWLTQAEAGVMELQKVTGSIYEELVSAGGVKSDSDKKNIAMIVGQLRDHYVDTLNSSFGDRFIFGGYNTPGDFAHDRAPVIKPFTVVDGGNLLFNGFNISQFDGWPSAQFNAKSGDVAWDDMSEDDQEALTTLRNLMGNVKALDVGPGINMPVSINGIDLLFYNARAEDGTNIMRNTFDMLTEVFYAIDGHPGDPNATPPIEPTPPFATDDLTALIKHVQDSQNHLLTKTAEIGGRQRRLELLEARYDTDILNYERMRSDAEDADLAEVIMNVKIAETVYQAALSAGARIIQPSLMDFLR